MVLEEAYVDNQRNNLANVAHEMDGLLQFNIDRMIFFRNGMQSALETPLDFTILRNAEQEYMSRRHEAIWSVALHNRRTLPVYGVSDAFVDKANTLSRDNPLSGNELMATLELGYLLRLTNNNRGFTERMLYVSRSGFFISTETLKNTAQALERYSDATRSPWFTRQAQRTNPGRGVVWQTALTAAKYCSATTRACVSAPRWASAAARIPRRLTLKTCSRSPIAGSILRNRTAETRSVLRDRRPGLAVVIRLRRHDYLLIWDFS